MGREHRIISGLQSSDVPVPPIAGLCTDEAVNGTPFYVMEFVDGHVLRDAAASAAALDEAGARQRQPLTRRHDGEDPRRRPRRCGTVRARPSRGVHRAPAQALVQPVEPGQDPRPGSGRSCARSTLERIPDQGPATIVHGDYRLDNCMVDDAGNVVAVLDWEICTLGDPLADLGLLQVTGRDPTTPTPPGRAAPPPRRASGIEPTSRRATPRSSGRDISSSTSTWRSPTGSSPASSKASTRATSAARSASRTRHRSKRSSCRSTAPPPAPNNLGALG